MFLDFITSITRLKSIANNSMSMTLWQVMNNIFHYNLNWPNIYFNLNNKITVITIFISTVAILKQFRFALDFFWLFFNLTKYKNHIIIIVKLALYLSYPLKCKFCQEILKYIILTKNWKYKHLLSLVHC